MLLLLIFLLLLVIALWIFRKWLLSAVLLIASPFVLLVLIAKGSDLPRPVRLSIVVLILLGFAFAVAKAVQNRRKMLTVDRGIAAKQRARENAAT